MGYMVKEGDVVASAAHTYKILKELNQGGFAFAYKASDENGKTVFFKQYKSPSKLVPWFKDYFQYEDELNRRLREHPVLKTASVYANEVFLGRPCDASGEPVTKHENIFQVFPFVAGNINLGDMIGKGLDEFDWEKRVYASTVFAFAMRNLHAADIVHCDLKPENVQVREDDTITMKYRPLLIDMDWSILSDRRAPWHGSQGYVGTVGYMSPEHLRGETPLEASDVFTVAIIICELLAGAHPFASHLGEDDLSEYVLSGKNDFASGGIPFKGSVPPRIKDLLIKALSPNAADRPTMEVLHTEFLDFCKAIGKGKVDTGTESRGLVPCPEPKDGCTSLVLTGDAGTFKTRASFCLDQRTLRHVSSQANFADAANQFKVDVSGGEWTITGNTSAPNATVLNGTEVGADPKSLKSGDVIALKGRSSGKTAMSITVKLVEEV